MEFPLALTLDGGLTGEGEGKMSSQAVARCPDTEYGGIRTPKPYLVIVSGRAITSGWWVDLTATDAPRLTTRIAKFATRPATRAGCALKSRDWVSGQTSPVSRFRVSSCQATPSGMRLTIRSERGTTWARRRWRSWRCPTGQIPTLGRSGLG